MLSISRGAASEAFLNQAFWSIKRFCTVLMVFSSDTTHFEEKILLGSFLKLLISGSKGHKFDSTPNTLFPPGKFASVKSLDSKGASIETRWMVTPDPLVTEITGV